MNTLKMAAPRRKALEHWRDFSQRLKHECVSLKRERDSLRADNARLREALEAVCTSSRRQLEGHGKGIPPSPNLETAFDQASAALAASGGDK